MRRLLWTLREQGAALSVLAIALLLGATLYVHWVAMPPLQARLQALEARPPSARRALAPPAADEVDQLRTFYRHFEGGASLPTHLKALHRLAQRHGIAMRQGEYRLVAGGDARLRQYQMTLPVHGAYPDLRRFVAAVLQEVPAAALDQVTFERRRVEDGAVEARVQFTVFLPAT